LVKLHASLIEAAMSDSEFRFSDDTARSLLALIKSKEFEYIQLNALTQDLMMTLADVGTSKMSIDKSIKVYTSLIMTADQV